MGAVIQITERRTSQPETPNPTPEPSRPRFDYGTLTDREKAIFAAGRRVGCDEGYLQGLELVREIAAYMGVPVPRHLVQAI